MASRFVRNTLQRAGSGPALPAVASPPSFPALDLASDPSIARQVRANCREGTLSGPTAQLAPGFLQANLVVMEKQFAFDFLMFTLRNPKSCPLLEVISTNPPESTLAPGSDLRRDLPLYRVWQRGQVVEERTDVTSIWPKDGVAFLLGCSFTFESSLKQRGLLAKESNSVSMYKTRIPNEPSGPFRGNLVVSMRMFDPLVVPEVVEITSKHPLAHGEPVAIGFAGQKELGIEHLDKPDFGEKPSLFLDESSSSSSSKVPVFWACGVTPQNAIEQAGTVLKDSIVITHAPGCMFVTDVLV